MKDRLLDWVYYAGEWALIRWAAREGPRGLIRVVFRIPVWLYRIGLGGLVGHNVLILAARGRRSGKVHVTAMRYEYDSAMDTFHVLSGWAGQTDWYRNVRQDRRVGVAVGRRRLLSTASLLPVEGAIPVIRSYLRRNPLGPRTIRIETGIGYDGTEEALLVIAAHYPAVALRPDD